MISITDVEKEAWASSFQKDLRLEFSDGTVLNNSNIVSESMSLEQTIADQSSLFGNVYSSSFRIQVFDTGKRLAGLTLNVTISISLITDNGYLSDQNGNHLKDENGNYIKATDDVTFTRNIGQFYVLSDKLTSDGIFRNLECYDMLYVALTNNYTSWYESLTFPMSLKTFRDAFFNEIGIPQKDVTLQNDSMSIAKKNISVLSGSAIIGNILALNTSWGYIESDGKFNYISPKTSADYKITDNSYVQGSFAFEEYETSAYTGITIIQTIKETVEETQTTVDEETGEETTTVIATYEQEVEQKITVGDDSGSVMTFQNNLFTYGKTDEELTELATRILSRVSNFSFTPSSITFPPYMGLELGDVFQITTSKKVVKFPVLDRRLSGITALKDTFTAEGVEYASDNANSTESMISSALSSASVVANMAKTAQQLAGEAQASADSAKEAADTAWEWADDAHDAAQTAWNHADDAYTASQAAQTSAGQAQASAIQANTSANSALTQLSTIEDVFDVLNWIADHGTYAVTTDTKVVPGKYYFTRSGTSQNYSYTVVENPSGNPHTKGYYELTGVDEAVTNFISTHLTLTNDGLYVMMDNSGYKVKITSSGVYIIDGQGATVATYSNSIYFNPDIPHTIGNSNSYIKYYDSNNDGLADAIAIVADSIVLGSKDIGTEMGNLQTQVDGIWSLDILYSTTSTTMSCTAVLRNGTENITQNYESSCYKWYMRNEDTDNEYLGYGYTLSFGRVKAGYVGTVICEFTEYNSSMKLTAEKTIYKKEAIKDGMTEASKKATNYLAVDSTGIMVANLNGSTETPSTATTRNVFIDNDSVDIRNGQNVLASFGEVTTVGDANSSHIEMRDKNMTAFADESTDSTYYTVGDLKDAVATITYVGDGSQKYFLINEPDTTKEISVYVDGVKLASTEWEYGKVIIQ